MGQNVQKSASYADRGAKRRAQTRSKLLQAAFEVIAEKGLGATTIQEITEAADVGFGSFYNHFDSKEEIFAAVIDHVVEGLGDALDRLSEQSNDPAEILADSIRHTVAYGIAHPSWRKFLLRNALSMQPLQMGLMRRLTRDVSVGIKSGRFHADDPVGVVSAIGGLVLTFLAMKNEEETPERAASLALILLGISPDKATKLSRSPLPQIDV